MWILENGKPDRFASRPQFNYIGAMNHSNPKSEDGLNKQGKPDRRGAKPGQNGQQAHVYDQALADKVESLAAVGASQKLIANEVELDDKTLKKYYGDEMKMGRERANVAVMQSMFKRAISTSHKDGQRAGEFWAQTHGGLVKEEKRKHSFEGATGADGQDLPTKITVEFVEGTKERPPEARD